MNRVLSLLLVTVLAAVGGCSVPHRMPEVGDIPLVHRIDIQQGNVVTQEMLSQLQLGMEKNKVQFVMGTPVIKDTFHANRWDYLYMYKKGRKDAERRHVALYFEDDKLVRIDGGVRPAAGPMEPITRENRQVVVPNQYQPGFVSRLVSKLPFVKNDETPDIPKKPVEKTVAAVTKNPAGDEQAAATEGMVGPEKPGFFKRIFTKSEPESPATTPPGTKPAVPETTAKSEAPATARPDADTTAKSETPATARPDADTTAKSETPATARPDAESKSETTAAKEEPKPAKNEEPEFGNIMNRGPIVSAPEPSGSGSPGVGDTGGGGDDSEPDVGPLPAPSPY